MEYYFNNVNLQIQDFLFWLFTSSFASFTPKSIETSNLSVTILIQVNIIPMFSLIRTSVSPWSSQLYLPLFYMIL